MGKGLKRTAAILLAMTMLLGSGLMTMAAAPSVDSTGAYLYASGETAYYVSPQGDLALSGYNPVSGEQNREFVQMALPLVVRPEKGSLAAGDDFIAYIDPDGGFGLVTRGYVGADAPLAGAPKVGTEMTMVAAGAEHLMVLNDMAEVRVYGDNSYGQLGSPDGGYVMEARAIVAGGESSFAIDEDNNLYAWGRNHVGQLGVGDKVDRYEPAFVMSNVKEVWTSGSHSFARTHNGVLYGWGSNTSGQLGFANTKQNVLKPQKIGSKYVDVAAGKRHTLFFDKYGGVYACGSNQNYELGQSNRENKTQIVSLNRSAKAMAAGDGFSLIVTEKSGTFAGSGRNDKGQLGLASKRTFAQGFTRLVLPEFASASVSPNASSFTGIVTEAQGVRLLVQGSTMGPIYVTIPASQQSNGTLFVAGDEVEVYFSGVVAESYPAQAVDVYEIRLVKGAAN